MVQQPTTVLRAPTAMDLPLLTEMRNNHTLQTRLMAVPRANPAERVQEWLRRMLDDPGNVFFIIAERDENRAVGHIQLTQLDTLHGHAELGIAIDEGFQGRGHGHAALQHLERYARKVFNLRKIHLKVLASNTAAIRMYEKRGFRNVGVLRGHFYHDGAFHDVTIMEKPLEAP